MFFQKKSFLGISIFYASVILVVAALLVPLSQLHAATTTTTWGFTASGDYVVSDPTDINFFGSVARLSLLNFSAEDIVGDTGDSEDAYMGDLDGDGDLDIYVVNFINAQNKIWINDSSANFTAMNIAGDFGQSQGAHMGDLDGDGDLDMYVANDSQQNRLWINDGSANFTAMNIVGDSGADSDGVEFADFDGDGDLDIYVANNGQNKLWINDGSANFTAMDITGDLGTSYGPNAGDLDGDGDLDIYVANRLDQQNKIWINDGSANFTAMNIVGDLGMSFVGVLDDFDGDGDLDIYVANRLGQQNKLWINDGSANFTAMDIAGDFGNSFSAESGDFDDDGDRDIYVANDGGGQNKIWINDGSANFTAMDITGDLGNSEGVEIIDIDGNGTFDIYVSNNGQNKLWINHYAPDSPYISPASSINFSSTIASFNLALSANTIGTTTFQVSTDNGNTWHYWDGSTWQTTIQTDGTETSSSLDINASIAILDTDGGDFLWRAYMNSNGDQKVEIEEISVVVEDPLVVRSRSSIKYICEDPQAANYNGSGFGRHKISLCEYDAVYVCKDPEAINYELNNDAKHKLSLCAYNFALEIEYGISDIGQANLTPSSDAQIQQAIGDRSCDYFTQHMKKGDRDGQVAQVKQEVGVTKTLFEVEFLQKILNSLGFDAGREDGIYGQQTLNAVSRFQQAHFNTVLKPWGLTAPTGITYQSTEVRLNEVLGCDDSVVLDNGIFVD